MFSTTASRVLFRRGAAALALITPAVAVTHNYVSDNQRTTPKLLTAKAIDSLTLPPFSVYLSSIAQAEAPSHTSERPASERAGVPLPGLPAIPAERVRNSNGKGGTPIYVTYGRAVYDVTDFVSSHPGGDHILLAAGGPLEPFWSLYSQHSADWVLELLEELRIGNLQVDEQWIRQVENVEHNAKDGPYANDPKRHGTLLVQGNTPFNAEPRADLLVATQLTPNDLFYVRNHMPVPVIREEDYELEIAGVDGKVLKRLGIKDLREGYKKHVVAAAIQCAGNRRNELDRVKKVKGGRWEIGAISNAEWGGVRLSDVLADIEKETGKSVTEGAQHMCFEGLDLDPAKGNVYAASVPMDVLRRVPNVLLAYEMNGKELPRDHGYPIRVVVPGIVGARNVKWLGKIVASKEESDSHWQRQDYRSFSPDKDWDNVDFSESPSIQEMPVVSAICTHKVDEAEGMVSMKGYAWSGDGKGIIRVDVSADGGKTWMGAELCEKGHDEVRNEVYDWTLWQADVKVPQGEMELVCKAVDSAYNTQPDSADAIWNLRGLLNNSWHRVTV